MTRLRRLAALLLLATFAGCLGRGGGADGEIAAGESAEPDHTAGEEILRLLDDMESSSEQAFDAAARDPFLPVLAGAAAPTTVHRPAPVATVKPAPVLRLQGVLGGGGTFTALIEGMPYGVGDAVGGFEIRSIGGDQIILERDGTSHAVPVGATLPRPGEGGIGS